jgi:hypothetical protein
MESHTVYFHLCSLCQIQVEHDKLKFKLEKFHPKKNFKKLDGDVDV